MNTKHTPGPWKADTSSDARSPETVIEQMVKTSECPECKLPLSRLTYVEDIGCSRDLKEINPKERVIRIHGEYTTAGFDEGGTNGRLCCGNCAATFPIPDYYELDFI